MANATTLATQEEDVRPPGRLRTWWPVTSRRHFVILGAVYALFFLILTGAAALQFRPGVVLGAIGLGAAMFRLDLVLRDRETGRRLRVIVPPCVIVLGVALVVVWRVSDGLADGFAFVGVCAFLVGAGQLVSAWRDATRWSPGRGIVVLLVAGLGSAAALSALAGGMSSWWLLVFGSCVFVLAPVGLSLLTEDVADRLPKPANRWSRGLLWFAGAAFVIAGVVLLARTFGLGSTYVAAAGLVVVVLIGAIAVNVPADIVIVAGVVALLWSAVPHGVAPDPARVPAENSDVIVAMGDSVMSGEGAPRFYEGTNTKDVNECRRAPTAFAPVTVARGNPAVRDRLLFVACSGARAENIHALAQQRGDPIGGAEGLNQLDHVAHLQKEEGLDVDLVVVSIGGNDASFGEIGLTCVAPGDCSEYGARWLEKLDDITPKVYGAYQKIRAQFRATVPVLVVPYPVPLRETGCDWSLLTANEHRFLHGYTRALNAVLRQAARDAGFYYLDEMETVLDRRNLRICDGEPDEAGVNFIAVNSVSGLLEQSLNPQNWFHNSLHPNERGHQVMADVLETWLENHPEPAARPNPIADQGPPQPPTLAGIMGDPRFPHCDGPGAAPARCGGTVHDWTRAQLVDLAWRAVVPLGTLVLGAWLLWLGAIWAWRSRSGAPRVRAGADRV